MEKKEATALRMGNVRPSGSSIKTKPRIIKIIYQPIKIIGPQFSVSLYFVGFSCTVFVNSPNGSVFLLPGYEL